MKRLPTSTQPFDKRHRKRTNIESRDWSEGKYGFLKGRIWRTQKRQA